MAVLGAWRGPGRQVVVVGYHYLVSLVVCKDFETESVRLQQTCFHLNQVDNEVSSLSAIPYILE